MWLPNFDQLLQCGFGWEYASSSIGLWLASCVLDELGLLKQGFFRGVEYIVICRFFSLHSSLHRKLWLYEQYSKIFMYIWMKVLQVGCSCVWIEDDGSLRAGQCTLFALFLKCVFLWLIYCRNGVGNWELRVDALSLLMFITCLLYFWYYIYILQKILGYIQLGCLIFSW